MESYSLKVVWVIGVNGAMPGGIGGQGGDTGWEGSGVRDQGGEGGGNQS